eukprot:RCo026976
MPGLSEEPALDEGEEVLVALSGVEWYCGQALRGRGDLRVTNQRVLCSPMDSSDQAVVDKEQAAFPFIVPFSSIVMHAICRERSEDFPRPCLLFQVEVLQRGAQDDSEDEADPSESVLDVRLAPTEGAEDDLDRLFAAFCRAASLVQDSDEEGQEILFTSDDQVLQLDRCGNLKRKLDEWDQKLVLD